MGNTYHAIILGKAVLSLSASYDGENLIQWKCSTLSQASSFNLQNQINAFRERGYNLYLLSEGERIYVVSAIPQDSCIPHPQWIMACGDYLAINAV